MSKIKVGQIYNVPYLGGKVVVTWISGDDTEFFCVRQDGFFFKGNCRYQDNYNLIAEYISWKEAVNSKEFKNVE